MSFHLGDRAEEEIRRREQCNILDAIASLLNEGLSLETGTRLH